MTKVELKKKLTDSKYFHQIIKEKTNEVEKLKAFIRKLTTPEKDCQDELGQKEYSQSFKMIKEALKDEEQTLCEFMLKKKSIEGVINLLPQPFNLVLYLRYVSCEGFKQIGEKMNYSEKRIYQLHDAALEMLLTMQIVNETLE